MRFFSAQHNAIEMRRELDATLVGEPTGERPSSYGEVRTVTLPNSGLQIQYSTEFFRTRKDSDAGAIYPDISALRPLTDFLAGPDLALDAALHSPPRRAK